MKISKRNTIKKDGNMMRNKYILFFDEIDKKFIAQAGGKVLNLVEMTKAEFQVPTGFA